MSDLNDAQLKLLEESIATHLAPCPMCKTGPWSIAPSLYAPPEINVKKGQTSISGTNCFPMAMITCQSCGFTSCYSVGIMGLMQQLMDLSTERESRGA